MHQPQCMEAYNRRVSVSRAQVHMSIPHCSSCLIPAPLQAGYFHRPVGNLFPDAVEWSTTRDICLHPDNTAYLNCPFLPTTARALAAEGSDVYFSDACLALLCVEACQDEADLLPPAVQRSPFYSVPFVPEASQRRRLAYAGQDLDMYNEAVVSDPQLRRYAPACLCVRPTVHAHWRALSLYHVGPSYALKLSVCRFLCRLQDLESPTNEMRITFPVVTSCCGGLPCENSAMCDTYGNRAAVCESEGRGTAVPPLNQTSMTNLGTSSGGCRVCCPRCSGACNSPGPYLVCVASEVRPGPRDPDLRACSAGSGPRGARTRGVSLCLYYPGGGR